MRVTRFLAISLASRSPRGASRPPRTDAAKASADSDDCRADRYAAESLTGGPRCPGSARRRAKGSGRQGVQVVRQDQGTGHRGEGGGRQGRGRCGRRKGKG